MKLKIFTYKNDKKFKYLRTNLTKNVHDPYVENYKIGQEKLRL